MTGRWSLLESTLNSEVSEDLRIALSGTTLYINKAGRFRLLRQYTWNIQQKWNSNKTQTKLL